MVGPAPNRRAVLKALALGASRPRRLPGPPSPRPSQGRGHRRRLRGRHLRPRTEAPRPRRHPGRAQPTYIACPFSNAVIAGLRPIDGQQFGYDAVQAEGIALAAQRAARVDASPAGRSPTARSSPTTGWCSRPASTCASTRCPATTRRRPRPCRMPGRPGRRPRSSGASSRPWRTAASSSCRSRQSLPLPARPLRAGEPDRPLPQDPQAALEDPRSSTPRTASPSRACSRRRGRSSIPALIEWVGAVRGRQGDRGRAEVRDLRHRVRALPRRRRQRHPAAAGRRHRAGRRRRPTAAAGARSTRSPSSPGCSRTST